MFLLSQLPCSSSDNYFNGGERHNQAFDDALDEYINTYLNTSTLLATVKYLYTNWTRPSGTYNRGAVGSRVEIQWTGKWQKCSSCLYITLALLYILLWQEN